jgi:osmotically-inducible protein OsmY
MSARSSDAWITAKVKTALIDVDVKGFDITRVKVVTERGVVYLMGLVTREEAEAATDVVRRVGGVQRVVRLFQYLD